MFVGGYMYRFKHYALTIAAIFGAQLSGVAESNSTSLEAGDNHILNRVARIQHESNAQNMEPEFLQNQQISQWYNWSNWQDWNNWYNY